MVLNRAQRSLSAFGQKRASGGRLEEVRFPPESGHSRDSFRTSALCQSRTFGDGYSITSSARTSSDGDTCRPSAMAVLRLRTNSKRVGCSTGRSAGLARFLLVNFLVRPI